MVEFVFVGIYLFSLFLLVFISLLVYLFISLFIYALTLRVGGCLNLTKIALLDI